MTDFVHSACGHLASLHGRDGCTALAEALRDTYFCTCLATFEDVIKEHNENPPEIQFARRQLERI